MATRKPLQVVSVTLALGVVCINVAPEAQEANAAFRTKRHMSAAAAG